MRENRVVTYELGELFWNGVPTAIRLSNSRNKAQDDRLEAFASSYCGLLVACEQALSVLKNSGAASSAAGADAIDSLEEAIAAATGASGV